jgi:hypothetical protein
MQKHVQIETVIVMFSPAWQTIGVHVLLHCFLRFFAVELAIRLRTPQKVGSKEIVHDGREDEPVSDRVGQLEVGCAPGERTALRLVRVPCRQRAGASAQVELDAGDCDETDECENSGPLA